jgi:sialate O-acetylesterase
LGCGPGSDGAGPRDGHDNLGENRVTVADVLAGEVWVASGQSNMQWPVERARDAEKEIAEANFPSIRLFDVKRVTSETPQDDVIGAWKVCMPESVKTILAVGYFFAWDVHQERKIPVGLIHTSWGGTPAQAWTSMPVLAADPALRYDLDMWDTVLATYTSAVENYERQSETWKSQ